MAKWIGHAKGWLRASLLRQFVALISLTGVLLLVLNYGFVSYYFNHSLLRSIEAVEADYMRMQAGNIEVQIRNYRNQVYEAVLDNELLKLAKQYMDTSQADRAALEKAILERISSKLQSADMAAATLVLPDGEVVFKNRLKSDSKGVGWFGYGGRTNYDRALAELCGRALEARNVQVGLEPYVFPTTGTFLLHMACPLFDMYTREVFGTVILSFNTRTLRNMTNPIGGAELHAKNSTGVLTSENGVVIAHQRAELIGKRLLTEESGPEAGAVGAIRFDQGEQVLSQPPGLLGFRLYRVIDKNALLEGPRRYTVNMTLVLSLIVVMGLLGVMLTVRGLMRSIRALQSGLWSVRSGELDVRVPTDEPGEIGQIIHSFNDMARQLHHSDRQRRIQEQETIDALNRQRVAEIKALENQINSHFLYNTLNSINYTALEGGNLHVSRQLKHLSRMLRYTFEKSDGVVSSEREAEWLGEYLALQKLRYGDAFDYRITMQPEVARWPMRKLLLQPFVENSLTHGLAGRARGGWIGIDFRRHSDGRMRVTMIDNGRGIPPGRMQALDALLKGAAAPDAVGIGLENALLRIDTYYQGKAKVVIRSWPGIGTKVVVMLPRYDRE